MKGYQKQEPVMTGTHIESGVREFHNKHSFPCDLVLPRQMGPEADSILSDLAKAIGAMATRIKGHALADQRDGDERLYRAHLMTEELSEVVQALADRDEVKLADGTGDLRYVVVGTDVTYGISSNEVDFAIQRSNMSKAVRNKHNDPRMRDKGPNYVKPDIEEAISRGRLHMNWAKRLKAEVGG